MTTTKVNVNQGVEGTRILERFKGTDGEAGMGRDTWYPEM
jgi:hypothetical protein